MVDLSSIVFQDALNIARMTDELMKLGNQFSPVIGLEGIAAQIAADTARVMEDFVKLGSHMQPLLAVDPLASLSSQFSLEAAKTSELLSRSFNLAAQVGPLLQIRKPTRRKFKRPERARRSAKPSRPSIRRPNSALEISSDARNDFAALALQLV